MTEKEILFKEIYSNSERKQVLPAIEQAYNYCIENKVADFASSMSTNGKTKIVFLDEANGITPAAQEALKIAAPLIQKTASKGTIHKNTASRKISRLTKRVNRMMPIG